MSDTEREKWRARERQTPNRRDRERDRQTDRHHYVLFVYIIYPNKEINVGSAVKV